MAWEPATALCGDVPEELLPCHVSGAVFRVGSYNIGWNDADRGKGIVELRQEVQSMVSYHEVHVLLLCEVFDIEDNLIEITPA